MKELLDNQIPQQPRVTLHITLKIKWQQTSRVHNKIVINQDATTIQSGSYLQTNHQIWLRKISELTL